jgi:hypothetical protein
VKKFRPQQIFMCHRSHGPCMAETETIRIYVDDKERIKEIAESRNVKAADVVSELMYEPMYRCPECEEPFDPEEVDGSTVREHGVMSTSVDNLVRGEREVKDFECPCCGERIRPVDIEAVDGRNASRSDVGVPAETEEQEFSTEEA